MHIFAHTLAIGAFLLITACGSQEPETKITPDAVETTTTVASGHGHDHGNQPTISMSLPIAGVMLDIAAQGTLRPSSEYHLEMVLVDNEIDIDALFTDRYNLSQAEEAYSLFDEQQTGKGVFEF